MEKSREKKSRKKKRGNKKGLAGGKIDLNDPKYNVPPEELVKMAQEYIDTLHIAEAQTILDAACVKFPTNTLALDTYAELLLSLGETEKAMLLQKRSAELEPNANGSKFLNLAECLGGKEAVKMYLQGIELLKQQQELHLKNGSAGEAQQVARQIGSAYASIAELYMTDCCDEPNAEKNCEKSLEIGLGFDPDNADALQCLANLRILRERDEEASKILDRVTSQIFAKEEEKVFNADFCKQTARLLMELSRFEDCVKVLNHVLSTSEDNIEGWYLCAFANYSVAHYDSAQDCLSTLRRLVAENAELNDPEIMEATKELEVKLSELKAQGVEQMDESEGSNESVSDSEEKMEDKLS